MKLEERTIGYRNSRDVQVSLPSLTGRGSPMHLDPLAPILTASGYLTGFQPELEQFVSTGLLRRIYVDDKEFGNWNSRMDKRKGIVTKPVEEKPVGIANIPLPPKITISSDRGIQYEDNRTTTAKALAEEVTPNNDGTFTYKGKRFTSKAALDTYIRTVEKQVS